MSTFKISLVIVIAVIAILCVETDGTSPHPQKQRNKNKDLSSEPSERQHERAHRHSILLHHDPHHRHHKADKRSGNVRIKRHDVRTDLARKFHHFRMKSQSTKKHHREVAPGEMKSHNQNLLEVLISSKRRRRHEPDHTHNIENENTEQHPLPQLWDSGEVDESRDNKSRAFFKPPFLPLTFNRKNETRALSPSAPTAYALPGGGQAQTQLLARQNEGGTGNVGKPTTSPPPPSTSVNTPPPKPATSADQCTHRGNWGIRGECGRYWFCPSATSDKKSQVCAGKETFDFVKRSCFIGGVCDSKIVCPDDTKKYAGLPEEGQDFFLQCRDGLPLPNKCPAGQIFQAATSSCVHA